MGCLSRSARGKCCRGSCAGTLGEVFRRLAEQKESRIEVRTLAARSRAHDDLPPCQMDRTLPFDEPHHLRHRVLGWNRVESEKLTRHALLRSTSGPWIGSQRRLRAMLRTPWLPQPGHVRIAGDAAMLSRTSVHNIPEYFCMAFSPRLAENGQQSRGREGICLPQG
jgi:hypothetical protein